MLLVGLKSQTQMEGKTLHYSSQDHCTGSSDKKRWSTAASKAVFGFNTAELKSLFLDSPEKCSSGLSLFLSVTNSTQIPTDSY